MSERKRLLFFLILILSVISLSISSITIGILYRTAFEENRERLVNIAQSRARIIEAMARYDIEKAGMIADEDPDHDPFTATLSQINEAHEKFEGFGETGEFTLARHNEDNIDFLIRHRHSNIAAPEKIPFHSILAEPMRLALSRKSGTIVGLDYRGERVLAAYEPVDVLNLGIVAKIDLSEVRAPFILAGVLALGISIILVFIGSFLFARITNPMIKKIIASEANFRLLVSEVKDYAIFRLNPEGIVFSWNEGAQLIKGYKAEEIIGEHFSRFFTEEDLEAGKPDNELEIAKRVGKYEEIGRRVRKDGTQFIANVVLTALRDDKGQLQGFSKVTRDITKTKQAEEELRANEAKLRIVIEQSPLGVCINNLNGSFVSANPAYEKLIGYTEEELQKLTFFDITHPDDRSENKDLFQGMTFEQTGGFRMEKRYIRKDGSEISVIVHAGPICDPSGSPLYGLALVEDITERKQAEQDLAKNLQSLNLGESLAGLGYFERNWQTDEGYWSQGFYKLLGESPEDVDCKHAEFVKYIHQDDRERVSNHIRETLVNRTGMDIEFRIVQANGNILEIHGRGKNFYDSNRKPLNTIGTFWDITDRKKADQELKESEENYQQVVSNITTAVWKADIREDGAFENTYTSPVYDELLGLPSDGSTDNWDKHLSCIQPEHKERVSAAFREAIESPGKVIDLDFEVLKANGQAAWFNSKGRCFEKNGKLHVFGSTMDITERKEAEALLHESEEKYRKMIENLMEGYYSVTLDGQLLNYNDEFCRILGLDLKIDHTGIQLPDFWQDPEDRKAYLSEFLEHGFIFNYVVNAKKSAGEKIVVQVNSRLIHDTEGKPLRIEGTFLDVTEHTRALEDRKNLEIHLRHQQKLEAIGTLAGGVAHEINNPINGIMNYAQLINDRLEKDSSLKVFSGNILKETDRIAKIVSNLLTFSRHDKESHSPAKIDDIINETISLVQSIFKQDQITLDLDIPDDLPKIRCRSQQIQQVLMNLLTNGRDALNDRYPEFDENKKLLVKVRTFEKEKIKWMRMTVEDHGNGVQDEIRDRIFDPFFTTKDRTKGTGLGLSISYGIVEEHLGEMSVESVANEYTRFHVDLKVNNGWSVETDFRKQIEGSI
jgi:PAS domain S-box-containing protein